MGYDRFCKTYQRHVLIAGAASRANALGVSTRLLVLAAMIVAIHAVWLLAGTAFARFLRHPLASRIINLVFAATLVLSERAIEKHTNSIFSKLGLSEERDLNRRVSAVLVYLHNR